MNTAVARPVLMAAPAYHVMPRGRVLRAYLTEAKYEMLRLLRTPAFSVSMLVLPLAIYLLFGVVMPHEVVLKNPIIANFIFAGFCVFAVTSPAVFGIGIVLAMERDAGLMKLKRALPAPSGSYLLAKMATAVAFAAMAMAVMIATGLLVGHLTLSATQLASMAVVLVLGSLPFCALGLIIGAYVPGSAAPGIANLFFLPMMWLSGIFFPLPAILKPWAIIWPTYHLGRVATAAAGLADPSTGSPWISVMVLIGVTVLLGGLALRRLTRKG
jgi:ABC-2 type transport system permease protein